MEFEMTYNPEGPGPGPPGHWLWRLPGPQQSFVSPHQPNLLQQSPEAQSAPPTCEPHCSAEAVSIRRDNTTEKVVI
ncbi:hypothetical protein KY285_005374 [Solanum tuberosum]|nr:hypothetical protein KY285_005374 [Solanum tuberosum]